MLRDLNKMRANIITLQGSSFVCKDDVLTTLLAVHAGGAITVGWPTLGNGKLNGCLNTVIYDALMQTGNRGPTCGQ